MGSRGIPFTAPMVRAILEGRKTQTRRIVKPQPFAILKGEIPCPLGAPGDELWVREAWRTAVQWNHLSPANLPIAGDWGSGSVHIDYLADEGRRFQHGRYRHARFMPKWASRLFLKIVSVRVERLQDISEADALAEGVTLRGSTRWETEAREAYRALWEQIYGGRYNCAWEFNPFVWVITFRREP